MGRIYIALALLVLLQGCNPPPPEVQFKGTDITGAPFGRQLQLTDHHGQARTLADFRGKLVVIFFGYTHCPDVCPTTLADIAQAFKLMPDGEPQQVQVLFVSVDPQRDAPEILKAYVPYFHPSFLGLYGDAAAVARTAREFKVSYSKHVEPGASDYLVDHSAGSYVLDQQGRLRLYLPYGHPPQDIAHDLHALLRAG